MAAGGVALALFDQHELGSARSQLNAVNAAWAKLQGGECDPSNGYYPLGQQACEDLLNNATARVNNLETTRAVGWGVAGAGGAVFVTGAVLLLTSDNPHKYDDKPLDQRLFAGWNVAPTLGKGLGFVSVWRDF
jgi:hypothetical protein